MTARDLLRALAGRWYITLLGGVLTLLLAFVVLHRPPVYYTQFEAVVLTPREPTVPNTLHRGQFAATPLAGVLVEDLNHGHPPLQMSQPGTTAYGEGLRHGYEVRLHNAGNQWEPIYQDPVIDIQVVESDAAAVRRQSKDIVDRLYTLLQKRQSDLPVTSQAALHPVPADPVVQRIGGSRTRAAGATVVIGGLLTLAAVYAAELFARRRRTALGRSPAMSPSESRGRDILPR